MSNFTVISPVRELLADQRLTATPLGILLWIMLWKGEAEITTEMIAERFGMTAEFASIIIDHLKNLGYLEVK